ncbi:antitoxin MazE family protein [Chelatococcus daeguensis]|uniref:Antitoxin MazE n=2 Tax=Chelatococcus TaxID=28209 RepID=A0AAC9JML0_9HYPH|nr:MULTISPECIES: antitoxin MazE family protein [Chelatococcus]APF36164.1 hypothetical protein BOQ54_01500 [Chelatococcus daeguensis]KZE35024.1 hypothetical protein AVW15_15290 [Chelatococcus daeguensis]MBM3083026.1 antitoxin MazE family protein [Chelatococcus daeguensis]CUA88887.1 Protein of unknown function (DUF3018) [Chelatococcus sambhunathii]
MAGVAKRVQRHRERLRAAGLKPVQIWIPDPAQPGFAEECRRQSQLIAKSAEEDEILDFIEAASDHRGWRE